MTDLEFWCLLSFVIGLILLFSFGIYYLDRSDRNNQRYAKQVKEKIKKMSCEELREYIIDEGDFEWFAKKVLDVKYRCDSTQDKKEKDT